MGSYFWNVWLVDPYGTSLVVAGLLSPILAVAVPAVLAWLIFWPTHATENQPTVCEATASIPRTIPQPVGEATTAPV
jgi:hypothetical protein